MEDMKRVYDAAPKFVRGSVTDITTIESGNTNRTYKVTYINKGKWCHFLLQEIRTVVFKEPRKVVESIDGILTHIKEKYPEEKTLELLNTLEGDILYESKDEKGETEGYWRAYNYIEEVESYAELKESKDPLEVSYRAGKAYGRFIKLLDGYPTEKLHISIPDFHNTDIRYEEFERFVENSERERYLNAEKEIEELRRLREEIVERYGQSPLLVWLGEPLYPLRVNHNDTKLGNVLLGNTRRKTDYVIDLDTIMPGSIGNDFGDGIRSLCNVLGEKAIEIPGTNHIRDENRLKLVTFNEEIYKAYATGFLEETYNVLTLKEIAILPISTTEITRELAMRFLGRYVTSDIEARKYFNPQYPEQDFDRAKVQLRNYHNLKQNISFMEDTNGEIIRKLKTGLNPNYK